MHSRLVVEKNVVSSKKTRYQIKIRNSFVLWYVLGKKSLIKKVNFKQIFENSMNKK